MRRMLEEYSGTSSALGMALEHFGRVQYSPDEMINYHTHSHYEFCLLESGTVRYLVDDTTYCLKPGDLVITRPGEYHSMSGCPDEGDGNGQWTLAFVNVRQMPHSDLSQAISSARVRILSDCSGLRPMIDDILAEARAVKFGSSMAVHALTVLFLVEVARKLRVASPGAFTLPYSRAVLQAMDYIGSHGTYATRVGNVAQAANLSESRLAHVFKEETGRTVREYLRNTLTERARRMLEDGSFTVTEMAERLGFPNIACFSSFFKTRQGSSPTAYANTSTHK